MPSEEKRRALGQVCAKMVSSKWSVGSGEERLRSGDVGGLRLEAVRREVEVEREERWRFEIGEWMQCERKLEAGGVRLEVMGPDDLLCSRNARSQTPLVGRAQWRIDQATLEIWTGD